MHISFSEICCPRLGCAGHRSPSPWCPHHRLVKNSRSRGSLALGPRLPPALTSPPHLLAIRFMGRKLMLLFTWHLGPRGDLAMQTRLQAAPSGLRVPHRCWSFSVELPGSQLLSGSGTPVAYPLLAPHFRRWRHGAGSRTISRDPSNSFFPSEASSSPPDPLRESVI